MIGWCPVCVIFAHSVLLAYMEGLIILLLCAAKYSNSTAGILSLVLYFLTSFRHADKDTDSFRYALSPIHSKTYTISCLESCSLLPCLHTHTHTHTHTHKHTHTHTHSHIYTHTRTTTHKLIPLCILIKCACSHVCIHLQTLSNSHARASAFTHIHTKHSNAYTRVRTTGPGMDAEQRAEEGRCGSWPSAASPW